MPRKPWLPPAIAAALAAVTVLIYLPVRTHEFLNWDDLTYIAGNDHVKGGLTWEGIRWAFTQSYSSNWHPLTWLSHMLDCQWFGSNSGAHHLVNVAFHAVNAVLLFIFLRFTTSALWRSAFVAALFALHPLHVESVAWAAERKDVLSTFFLFLTLLAYAKYAVRSSRSEVRGSRFYYLVALSFFAFGLMSKPMLVTLPFVLLLLDYWPLGRTEQFRDLSLKFRVWSSTALLLEKVPFLVLSLASCIITVIVQKKGGAVASLTMVPLSHRFENAAVTYIEYLSKFFWPAGLSPIYPHPDHWAWWQVTGSLAILCLITIAAWIGRRQVPFVIIGWLWYLGTLAPVIGIVQVGSQAYADRYTYIPLIGIMFAVTWLAGECCGNLYWGKISNSKSKARGKSETEKHERGYERASSPQPSPPLQGGEGAPEPVGIGRPHNLLSPSDPFNRFFTAFSLFIVLTPLTILGVLAWRTSAQLPYWQDSGTLYGRVLELFPDNVQATYGLGTHLVDSGHVDEGKRWLEKAIQLQPAFPEALGAMASLLDGQGKYGDAVRFYEAALKAQPDHAFVLNNFAWLRASCPDGEFRNGPEAVPMATRACELTGYNTPLFIGTLAAAQAETGDFQSAIGTAERAAELASSLRLEETAARNRQLIELYRQGKPARAEAPKQN